MSDILISHFVDPSYQPIKGVRLDDHEYARALQRFPGVCTDVVLVHDERFWLAKRRSKPHSDWWWIGGGVMAGTDYLAAVKKNLLRETTLDLEPKRFTLHAIFTYMWPNRQQEPQDIGCHMEGWTYAVEVKPEEIALAARSLNEEYDRSLGIQGFDRSRIVDERLHPHVLMLYDKIFPRS